MPASVIAKFLLIYIIPYIIKIIKAWQVFELDSFLKVQKKSGTECRFLTTFCTA